MNILIVAFNVSWRMGGEAVLPFHYIREYQKLGHTVYLITNERVRPEVLGTDFIDPTKTFFTKDTYIAQLSAKYNAKMPGALRILIGHFVGSIGEFNIRRKAAEICKRFDIDIIHQQIPVSPKAPSFMFGLPVPVVVGPMNGNMSMPKNFESYADYAGPSVKLVRCISPIANWLISGKPKAQHLLVSNKRTREGLPKVGSYTKISQVVENGVDLSTWHVGATHTPEIPTFVYVGRLIRWKAVDLSLKAFMALKGPARFIVIGEGPERAGLEEIAQAAKGTDKEISFLGFLPQDQIRDELRGATSLVLSSLYECGGAVVLEAMACGKPAIGPQWGGPMDYITPETGFLIPPTTPEQFTNDLTIAMQKLADSPDLCESMGQNGRQRILEHFAWEPKVAGVAEILEREVRLFNKETKPQAIIVDPSL